MQIGEYVRTKKRGFQPPQIAKIRGMEKDSGYHNQYFIELDHNLIPDYEFCIYKEDIEKSSPNIIDLIEVGDYVNGKKVIKVWEEPFGEFAGQIFTILDGEETAPTIREIKSIVTKEQFKIMEYKVGVDKECKKQ
jgi:hypothetical protein